MVTQRQDSEGAPLDPILITRHLQFSLPYAVVLGGWERWLQALVASDDDGDADPEDLSWYHAPADWHLAELPASLDAFATTVRGRLFAR